MRCNYCRKRAETEYCDDCLYAYKNLDNKFTKRLRRHSITKEIYFDLLRKQKGRCGICKSPAQNLFLNIDHDHSCCKGPNSCGKCVRGLLCNKCNLGLGYFDDNPMSIAFALRYLDAKPFWSEDKWIKKYSSE